MDLRLFDLRVQRGDLRAGRGQLGLGGLVVATGAGVLREHLLLPLEGQLRLLEQRLLGGALGLDVGQRGLGVGQGVLLRQRIDLGDRVAGLHLVAEIDVQHLDLPGHLGADADLIEGFQGTGGHHRLLDAGRTHPGGQQPGSRGGGVQLAVAQPAGRDDGGEDDQRQEMFACEWHG